MHRQDSDLDATGPYSVIRSLVRAKVHVEDEAARLSAELARSKDHAKGLRAVVALRRLLAVLEVLRVECALAAGASWSGIAAELGVARQAVHKKCARRLRRASTPGTLTPGRSSMTAEHHRTMAQQSHLLRRAAASEAVRAGRTEVDVEHVLVALLASGGPSARLLLRAGADLAGVRRAASEVQAEDGALGPSGLDTQHRPSGAGAAVEEVPAASVPVNARVQAVLDELPLRVQETALLAALLAESPRAGRLLQQQGVDVPALRAALATPIEVSAADAGARLEHEAYEPDLPAPPGWTWQHVEHRQEMPVQAADVWALVSDPARRPQWDTRCAAVHVDPDGSERVVARGANPHQVSRQVVTHLVPGQAITWGRPPDPQDVLARAGADVVHTTSIHLVHDQTATGGSDGRTVLHLSAGWLVPARRRWLRWPLTRMFRTQLRLLAQGIALAAPGAPALQQDGPTGQ